MRTSSFLYLTLLASVAACSSGGGGSGSSGVATITNPPPAATPAFAAGTSTDAQVVGFDYNCPGDPCGAGTPTSTAGNASTVTLTNDGAGNVTAMNLNITEGGANISHTFDLTAAVGAPQTGFFQATESPAGDPNTYNVIFAGSADPTHSLTYVTYGYWSQTNADPAAQSGYGAFVAGNATPAGNMPITTTANYSGGAIGQLSANGANPGFDILSGTLSATANFDARTVNGSMVLNATGDNVAAAGGTGAWNTVSFSGSIAPNSSHFAGTVSAPATTAASVVQTEAMSGPLAGGFYGRQADEIGGTFNLAGAGGSSALGAFGGHK